MRALRNRLLTVSVLRKLRFNDRNPRIRFEYTFEFISIVSWPIWRKIARNSQAKSTKESLDIRTNLLAERVTSVNYSPPHANENQFMPNLWRTLLKKKNILFTNILINLSIDPFAIRSSERVVEFEEILITSFFWNCESCYLLLNLWSVNGIVCLKVS